MIDLLKTMIEASKAATLPLDMGNWHDGASCCLCGDVADYLGLGGELHLEADYFSGQLDIKSRDIFGFSYLSRSIYFPCAEDRLNNAWASKIFTEEELQHPHLTTDHSDRAIAIDYIELVIRKCEDRLGV